METQPITVERSSEHRAKFLSAVGTRILRMRRNARLTEREFASDCGISRSALRQIESGRNAAGLTTIVRIVECLRRRSPGCEALSLDTLVYGEQHQ